MSFPGNVNRYVVSGGLPGGERWSTGFYGSPTLPGTAQTLASQWAGSGSLTLLMMQQWQKLLSTTSTIDRVDVYVYGSGRTIIDQASSALPNLPGQGTSFASNRQSLVVTLRTAVFGARGRGRMYLPANGFPVVTDGLFSPTGLQAIIDATAAALGNLNARVVSEAGSTSNEVNQISCDRVPDSQRGRSDRQTSSRVVAAVL